MKEFLGDVERAVSAHLGRRHAVAVPNPIAAVRVTGGALLLQEALPEVPAQSRTNPQWAAMGSALGALHNVHGSTFDLADFDGFFARAALRLG